MSDSDLDRLARCCSSALSATCADDEATRTRKALLELLLEGRPVSGEELARSLDRDLSEVRAVIERLGDLEFDSSGRIVGSGISLRPTPHRMTIEGRTVFTWCAWDTLTFPPLLGRTASVASTCPRSKSPIELVVTPREVRSVRPGSAVVSLVPPPSSAGCHGIRESFCSHVHFFRSAGDASQWLDDHADGVLLEVGQAYELGRRVCGQGSADGGPR